MLKLKQMVQNSKTMIPNGLTANTPTIGIIAGPSFYHAYLYYVKTACKTTMIINQTIRKQIVKSKDIQVFTDHILKNHLCNHKFIINIDIA